jgi:hypothetical protein
LLETVRHQDRNLESVESLVRMVHLVLVSSPYSLWALNGRRLAIDKDGEGIATDAYR